MEENRTWEADNYWIELLKKYNRSKLEELRKEKAEKNGAIVLDPTDTSTPARLYENIPSTEILEQQSTLERQITSMADMLVLLDRENPDFIGEIISCEKGEKIRQEQENHSLSDVHERILLSIPKTFRYINLQTALILAMEDTETQEKVDKEARKRYSWYFSNPNKIVKRYISSINRELGKDGHFRPDIYGENWKDNSALKDTIIVQYIMGWHRKMVEESKDYGFLIQMKWIQFRNILVDRETVNSLDKLAIQLGYDETKKLVASKVFAKYTTRCMETAATWLDDQVEKWEVFSFRDEEKVDYHAFEYVQTIFDDILFMAQNPNDNSTLYDKTNFVPLECSPLGIAFDLINGIKWYPKFGHEEEKKKLFYEAALNCSAACAAIEFEGADIDDLSATNLIRLSKLTDPQWFIINLFYSYVINQIAWEYREKDLDANYLLNKEYESLLARAREESMETIQNLKEQVEDQRQKIEQLQSTIRWKNDREKETDQLVAGKTDNLNDQIRILEKKLSKMQDVILEKDALIEEQKAQLTDYEEILKYKEDEGQAENEECSLDELKKQVILFVGGHEDLLTELRKELPLCKFLSKSTEPMPDMSKIDRVVVFYKFANHTTFNKIMASVRKIQIPVQYIDRKNYSQVLEQLRRNTIS